MGTKFDRQKEDLKNLNIHTLPLEQINHEFMNAGQTQIEREIFKPPVKVVTKVPA